MAFHSFVAGERLTAALWNDYVGRRVVADCTSGTRPTSPVEGEPIYETDTDKVYIHSGASWVQFGAATEFAAWTSFTPTWASSGTQPVIGNGTITGFYRTTGKTVIATVTLTAGSTTTFGTGNYTFTLPGGATYAHYCWGTGQTQGAAYYPLTVLVSGTTFTVYVPTASGDGRLTGLTGTVPQTLASTHTISFTAVFDIA